MSRADNKSRQEKLLITNVPSYQDYNKYPENLFSSHSGLIFLHCNSLGDERVTLKSDNLTSTTLETEAHLKKQIIILRRVNIII